MFKDTELEAKEVGALMSRLFEAMKAYETLLEPDDFVQVTFSANGKVEISTHSAGTIALGNHPLQGIRWLEAAVRNSR